MILPKTINNYSVLLLPIAFFFLSGDKNWEKKSGVINADLDCDMLTRCQLIF